MCHHILHHIPIIYEGGRTKEAKYRNRVNQVIYAMGAYKLTLVFLFIIFVSYISSHLNNKTYLISCFLESQLTSFLMFNKLPIYNPILKYKTWYVNQCKHKQVIILTRNMNTVLILLCVMLAGHLVVSQESTIQSKYSSILKRLVEFG